MNEGYYLDSCIWLNLLKKESGGEGGIPHWEIALNFLEKVEDNDEVIYVSGIVLKELYFILKNDFWKAKKFFKESDFIEVVKTAGDDYDLARGFEDEDLARISFYDYLHVAIVKRLGCRLVTRDKDLIRFATDKIKVMKPEDLIS